MIDLIAAVPFDLLLFGTGTSDTMTITGVLKTARLMRLLRVAKKMDQYSEYGAVMLLILLAIFALVAHWLACFFYAFANAERPLLSEGITWLDQLAEKEQAPYLPNDTLSGPSIKAKYVTAMYFTLTVVTTTGFGNVAPNTNLEKLFSIGAMIIGCKFAICNVKTHVRFLFTFSLDECRNFR